MKKGSLIWVLVCVVLAASVAGCNGLGLDGGLDPSTQAAIDAIDTHANNTKAVLALLKTQGNFTIQKMFTNESGYAVFQNMATGELVAYNVDKYSSTMVDLASYKSALTAGDVIGNLSGTSTTVWHDGYWTSSGHYDQYNNWIDTSTYSPGYSETVWTYSNGNYSFEEKRTSAKDLESVAANAAKIDAKMVQNALVSRYGFSAERAASVATLTKQMKEIAGTRELTDADKSLFTQQALGADYKSLAAAMKSSNDGDSKAFDQLVQQAAVKNGTTPEKARQLILEVGMSD